MRKTYSITLPEDVVELAKVCAKSRGISFSHYVQFALAEQFEVERERIRNEIREESERRSCDVLRLIAEMAGDTPPSLTAVAQALQALRGFSGPFHYGGVSAITPVDVEGWHEVLNGQ